MIQPQMVENLKETTRIIFMPTDETEYERLRQLLDEITDEVRDNENHPLASTMEVLGVLIEAYENEHIPEPEGDGVTVLKYLMAEYDLKQSDMTELGSQGVVSEILSGKRTLNLRQVKALSQRFNISPSVFV